MGFNTFKLPDNSDLDSPIRTTRRKKMAICLDSDEDDDESNKTQKEKVDPDLNVSHSNINVKSILITDDEKEQKKKNKQNKRVSWAGLDSDEGFVPKKTRKYVSDPESYSSDSDDSDETWSKYKKARSKKGKKARATNPKRKILKNVDSSDSEVEEKITRSKRKAIVQKKVESSEDEVEEKVTMRKRTISKNVDSSDSGEDANQKSRNSTPVEEIASDSEEDTQINESVLGLNESIIEAEEEIDLATILLFVGDATKMQDLREPYRQLKIRKSLKFTESMDIYMIWHISQNQAESTEILREIHGNLKKNATESVRLHVLELKDLKNRFKQLMEALKSDEQKTEISGENQFEIEYKTNEEYFENIGKEPLNFQDFQFFPAQLPELIDVFEISTNQEKTKILDYFSKGFDWNTEEFQQYLKALMKFDEISDKFQKMIPTKTIEEIKEYDEEFFKKFSEIKSFDVSETASNGIFKRHAKILEKVMGNPGDLSDLVYQLRGFCELKYNRSFDVLLLESTGDKTFAGIYELMLENTSLQSMVKKCQVNDLVDRFLDLMEAAELYFGEKEHTIIDDPKKFLDTNESLETVAEFLDAYRKPILSPYHFYPDKLHKLVEKENHYNLGMKDGKIKNFKNPLKFSERQEMKKLRRQGFCTWTEKEIDKIFKGIEIYGLRQPQELSEYMGTRTVQSVEKYCKVLSARYREVPDEKRKNCVMKILKQENSMDSDPESDFDSEDFEEDLKFLKCANKGCQSIQNIQIPYSEKDDTDKFQTKLDRGLVWLMISRNFEDEASFFKGIEETIQKEAGQAGDIKNRCLELIQKFKIHIQKLMKEDIENEKKRIKRDANAKKTEIQDYKFHPDPKRLQELLQRDYLYKSGKKDKKNQNQRLNKSEFAEMKSLLSNGFTDWNTKDLKKFLSSIKKNPPKDYEKIAKSFKDKPSKEVKNYCETFWKRFEELNNEEYKKVAREALEKEEKRVQELQEKEKSRLRKFLALSKEILENTSLDLVYNKELESEDFSKEIDEILLKEIKNVDLDEENLDFYEDLLEKIKEIEENFAFSAKDVENRCVELMKAYNKKLKLEGKRLSNGKVVKNKEEEDKKESDKEDEKETDKKVKKDEEKREDEEETDGKARTKEKQGKEKTEKNKNEGTKREDNEKKEEKREESKKVQKKDEAEDKEENINDNKNDSSESENEESKKLSKEEVARIKRLRSRIDETSDSEESNESEETKKRTAKTLRILKSAEKSQKKRIPKNIKERLIRKIEESDSEEEAEETKKITSIIVDSSEFEEENQKKKSPRNKRKRLSDSEAEEGSSIVQISDDSEDEEKRKEKRLKLKIDEESEESDESSKKPPKRNQSTASSEAEETMLLSVSSDEDSDPPEDLIQSTFQKNEGLKDINQIKSERANGKRHQEHSESPQRSKRARIDENQKENYQMELNAI